MRNQIDQQMYFRTFYYCTSSVNLLPKSPVHNSSLDNISDFCNRIGSLVLEGCTDFSLSIVLVSFCLLPRELLNFLNAL